MKRPSENYKNQPTRHSSGCAKSGAPLTSNVRQEGYKAMDPNDINVLIIVGVIANLIISRVHKLSGGIFGILFSTVVLIVGLLAIPR